MRGSITADINQDAFHGSAEDNGLGGEFRQGTPSGDAALIAREFVGGARSANPTIPMEIAERGARNLKVAYKIRHTLEQMGVRLQAAALDPGASAADLPALTAGAQQAFDAARAYDEAVSAARLHQR
jgi:hypothetical protein